MTIGGDFGFLIGYRGIGGNNCSDWLQWHWGRNCDTLGAESAGSVDCLVSYSGDGLQSKWLVTLEKRTVV